MRKKQCDGSLTYGHSYLVIEDWYTVGDEERNPRDPIRITDSLGQIGSKDTGSLPSSSPLKSNLEDGDVFASLVEEDGNQSQSLANIPATRAKIGLDRYTTQLVASDAHSTSALAGKRKRPASGQALRDIDVNTSLGQNNTKRIKGATDGKHSTVDSPTDPLEFNRYLVLQGNHASTSYHNEYHNTTATTVDGPTSTRTPVETRNNSPLTSKAKSLALSSSAAPYISRTTRPAPSLNTRMPVSHETALPITRPLRIQPLRSILSPNNRRNSIVDVLAVITFVSPHVVTPPRLPPKRDLRLLDPSCPSTRQPVLFSVFVNPDRFRPAVGTVALFRSVTTHEWNGGSLNAYDKDCAGRKWFLSNPVGVDGCDVQALEDFYKKWLDGEQKKEAEKELLKVLELEERQRAG